MGVHVGDAASGLTRQPRSVEVVDVAVLRVEGVEQLCDESRAMRQAVATLQIDERRLLRLNATVLDERSRAEMTNAHRAERLLPVADRHTCSDHATDGSRNAIARR